MYPPPPAPRPSRRGPLIAAASAAGFLILVVTLLAVLGATSEDDPAADPSPAAAASSPSPAGSSSRAPRAVPSPDEAEQRAYLAALRRIDPGLAESEERALRRGRSVCERIVRPPGGTMTLERYVVLALSGGSAQLDEGQAREVVRAVRVWCR